MWRHKSPMFALLILMAIFSMGCVTIALGSESVVQEINGEDYVELPTVVSLIFTALTPIFIQVVKKKVANRNIRFLFGAKHSELGCGSTRCTKTVSRRCLDYLQHCTERAFLHDHRLLQHGDFRFAQIGGVSAGFPFS